MKHVLQNLLAIGGLVSLSASAVSQSTAWSVGLSGPTVKANFAYRDVLRSLGGSLVRTSTFNPANGNGMHLWSAYAEGGLDIVSTTDDKTYVGGSQYGGAILRAINAQGLLDWYYFNDSSPNVDETIVSVRATQDRIYAFGTVEAILGSEPRETLRLYCFNRANGQLIFARNYFVNGTGWSDQALAMRAYGTNLVLIGRSKPAGGTERVSVARVDAETGNLVTAKTFPILGGTVNDTVVDSTGKLYIGGQELLSVDAAATPPAKLYNVDVSASKLLLSKGALYAGSPDGIRRLAPADGSVVWSIMDGGTETFTLDGLTADAQGRLYVVRTVAGAGYWGSAAIVSALDPASGAKVWTQDPLYESFDGDYVATWLGVNTFGEVAMAGGYDYYFWDPFYNEYNFTRLYEANVLYQKPQPVDDAYTMIEGENLVVGGNGVLQNDLYVNPERTKAVVTTPPTHGALSLNENGSFSYNSAGAPTGIQTFAYKATRGTFSTVAQVRITVNRGLAAFTLAKYVLAGQNATLGTVTLSSPGAASTVTLTDDSSLVSTPSSVIVPAGQTTKTFGAYVVPVSVPVTTQISATFAGVTRTVSLQLVPLIPTAIALTPSTVTGGNTVSARVVINGVAGSAGKMLAISDNSSYCAVPPTVTVPPGATQVIFNITTTAPPTPQIVTIKASVTAGLATSTLRINP